MFRMARGAEFAVCHFFHSGREDLMKNIRCEIYFIMRRADAGADLYDEVFWRDSESTLHFSNHRGDNFKFCPFASGVNQADASGMAVY